jgi:osmoprotectant transport system permease protein
MTLFEWLTDPANWTGSNGIPVQVGFHLLYTVISLAIASAIAIPLGIFIGFTGKGEAIVAGSANALRALPTLGLLILLFLVLAPVIAGQLVFVVPTIIVLVLLAIPPILTNTYTGVRQVDRDTVDSARGMGMTGVQVVRRVELPLALPLIFGGIRISAVNVVATATIAPLAGVVTLGDPIINVNTYGDEGRLAAALVVALLAVATELVLGALQRAVTPRGLKLEGGGRWRRLAFAMPNNRREAPT